MLQSLRRIIRAVELHSRKLAAIYKVTAPQLVCLLTIADCEPITATELAKKVQLSASTVVGILDRLEQKDLIRRERSRKDRRIVMLYLTDKGRKSAQDSPSPLQDKLAEALKHLPELEQATVALSLERVAALMEAPDVPADSHFETTTLSQDHSTNSETES